MDHRISISLGVGLLGLVAWTALGTGPSTQPFTAENVLPIASIDAPPANASPADTTLADATPADAQSVSADAQPADDTTTPDATPAPLQTDRNRRNADDGTFTARGRKGQSSGFMGGLKPAFSEEDVERAKPEAQEFWNKNSPERFKFMQSLSPGRRAVWEAATTRMYLNYQQTREKSPELYAVIVSRVQAEDNVFHIVSDLKKANEDARASKPLREAVESLVTLNLKERHLRLDQLAKTLKEQQDTLKSDEQPANFSSLVDKRLETAINQRQYSGRDARSPRRSIGTVT